jgi:hypothetical protein
MYQPLHDCDAINCPSFEDYLDSHWFTMKEFYKAEEYSEKEYGEITYQGIREWCLKMIGEI